ncbi:MAG: LamG-like jellyroll fold domain-containing protein [Limisphaerales bacterium]
MKTKSILLPLLTSLVLVHCALAQDVRQGLAAYWPLNTLVGTGPVTTPEMVGGYDLTGPTMTGSEIVTGQFGNAVSFNGSTDYMFFTNTPGVDIGVPVSRRGSWTISLWVKGTGPGQANKWYFIEGSSTSINPVTGFYVNNNTNPLCFVRDTANTTRVNAAILTNGALDGTWHHLAMTYDAATAQFRTYVDGKLDFNNSFVPNTTGSTPHNQVGIGAQVRSTIANYFQGALDDVALWNRALTQAEINEVRTNGIATPIPAFAPAFSVLPLGATNLITGDNFTLSAIAYGTRPLAYQWFKDGLPLSGATNDSLTLTSLTTNDNGSYALVVTNVAGSVTSAVAIAVNDWAAPDLTNGLVAYWPLDNVTGTKTPDLVSAYDLTLFNMNAGNLTAGKWGNALAFSNATQTMARRIHNPGDLLPIYPRTNFTVSFWVNGTWGAASWAFTEASTLNNNPAFCLGQRASFNDKLNTFIRTTAGVQVNDNRTSTNVVWDSTWHHITWVQRSIGANAKADLYIDGVLDGIVLNPGYPVDVNNTALGAFGRATPGQWITALIDDVAIWERPLSPTEVAILSTGYITNPPVRLSPLAINSFKSDLPAVVEGGSTVLRWDVPASADTITIDVLGNVAPQTVFGVGSTNISPAATTAYVLTVTRTTAALGYEEVKATNIVGVVSGVATNWALLDTFDYYAPGPVGAAGIWSDMYSNSVQVVLNGNNRMIRTVPNPAGAYLRLQDLKITEGQGRTLFFRMMIPAGGPVGVFRQPVGVTDKPIRFTGDTLNDVGPTVQLTVNDPAQTAGDWQFAVRNAPYSALTLATNLFDPGAVYRVWIDITNAPFASWPPDLDLFTVHIQKEGDPVRTTILTDIVSDRDITFVDPILGPALPNLDRLFVACQNATASAWYDDFYISQNGYNSTVPRPFGYAGPALPALTIQPSGSQLEVLWTEGVLQEATDLAGPWTDVTGATPPSYLFTPGAQQKFFRARSN